MVVIRPNRVQVCLAFLLLGDNFDIRNAIANPAGIGIEELNEIVTTERTNNPVSFIKRKGS